MLASSARIGGLPLRASPRVDKRYYDIAVPSLIMSGAPNILQQPTSDTMDPRHRTRPRRRRRAIDKPSAHRFLDRFRQRYQVAWLFWTALAQMRGDHRPEVVHPAAHGARPRCRAPRANPRRHESSV